LNRGAISPMQNQTNYILCHKDPLPSSSTVPLKSFCEVISLDCLLLLMDTVNVSSRIRTIAYRSYRTPVWYTIHFLCNVNKTPSSDSWCCFSFILIKIRIWSRIDKLNKFGLSKNPTLRFWMWNTIEHPGADKILIRNLETQFCSSPTRSMEHQVKYKKEMIGHISFDDTISSLFLNFSNNGRARLLVKISGSWFSVLT